MLEIKEQKDIYSMDTETLWNIFLEINEETKEYKKEMDMVRNGINISFPIQYLINEWFEIYPASKRVTIKGYGKFEITKFMEEKEEREKIMRKTIAQEALSKEVEEPRTR